jgi:N6-adenosine-specific RNA methylase IME4
MNQSRDLTLLSQARRDLAEAKSFGEVKTIRDKGQAAIKWAKSRRDIGLDAQNDAAEIVLDAERQLGVMLAETEKNRGVRLGGNMMLPPGEQPTLADLGISKMQSSRWQSEAGVPEEAYREFIEETRQAGKQLTSGALVKLGRQQNEPPEETLAEPVTGVVGNLSELIDTGQRFGTIYADPPWKYGNQATRSSTDNHYSTMTVDDICAEPVAALTAENCHLHLWTTNAFLFDAKRVMEAWGFKYKSVLVWVKPQMGIGNYWRVSHEFLLFGLKGKSPFRDRGQMSWIEVKRTKHSRKPPEVRERVEKVSPGPYLEMYGREAVDDWTIFGNQIKGPLPK